MKLVFCSVLYVVSCIKKVREVAMKEKYELYKLNYKKYIILFKCGNFYIALNDDAIVMNNVFKYKIIESANFIKSGFPISSLSKALSILDEKQINYVIVDKEIMFKNKNANNKYSDYLNKNNNVDILLNRINTINKILKNNLSNPKIDSVLNSIERDLCKINY